MQFSKKLVLSEKINYGNYLVNEIVLYDVIVDDVNKRVSVKYSFCSYGKLVNIFPMHFNDIDENNIFGLPASKKYSEVTKIKPFDEDYLLNNCTYSGNIEDM